MFSLSWSPGDLQGPGASDCKRPIARDRRNSKTANRSTAIYGWALRSILELYKVQSCNRMCQGPVPHDAGAAAEVKWHVRCRFLGNSRSMVFEHHALGFGLLPMILGFSLAVDAVIVNTIAGAQGSNQRAFCLSITKICVAVAFSLSCMVDIVKCINCFAESGIGEIALLSEDCEVSLFRLPPVGCLLASCSTLLAPVLTVIHVHAIGG